MFTGFFAPGVNLPVIPGYVRVVVFDVCQIFVHVVLTAAIDDIIAIVGIDIIFR